MTREERIQKQKLCDEFITKLDSLIDQFEIETGIMLKIHSISAYELTWSKIQPFKESIKLTHNQAYWPSIKKSNGSDDSIYFMNDEDMF